MDILTHHLNYGCMFRTIRTSDPRFENEHLRIVTVKSSALKGRGDITLYVPPNLTPAMPIAILLHGVYGSHWSWSLGGGAHRTAHELIQAGDIQPMILAMPSDGLWGDGSGYLPHLISNYEEWIVKEVPEAVKIVVAEATDDSPLFITGLSMGGFGALRLGGKYASLFKGISAHSAITDFEQMAQFVEEPLSGYHVDPHNYSVIEALKGNELPPLRFDCGLSDSLLDANRMLHDQLVAAGISHMYEEFEGGHEWPYWEEHIKDSFLFFDSILNKE